MTPSKKSRAGKYWFERDPESANQYLDDLFEKSEGSVFYLGEWHTHPERSIEPSDKDLSVIADLIPQSTLVADFLICVIVDSEGTLIVWAQSKTRVLGLVNLENASSSAAK
jgi:integrative and conjugative element protein (TIGR02256 family)